MFDIQPQERTKLSNLFPSLSDANIDRLVEIAEIKHYPEQTILCEQDDYADTFYVLLDGAVGIYLEWADEMHRIEGVKHGCFGEVALFLDNRNRTATVITEKETRLIEVSKANFASFSNEVPAFAQDVSRMIINRLITSQDKLAVSRANPGRETQITTLMAKGLFVTPSFGAPRLDREFHCDIFVVMPFEPKLRVVYDRILMISEKLGVKVKRADDLFSPYPIIKEIWSVLHNCRLVIADCTYTNPNVFYELGIAHTLGKDTITITQTEEHVPFDIRQWRYIKYTPDELGLAKLDRELTMALKKILKL